MSASTMLSSVFQYKGWANSELIATMSRFDTQKHTDQRHLAIRILNHTYVVDRIFAAHLQRMSHQYTATNTAETPTLDELGSAISASDRWYLDYVLQLTAPELQESIDFTFTDGAPGRMSREEMLSHVVLHGGYHRGAIGNILATVSIKPPRDVFTGFLHFSQPTSRRRDGHLGQP